MVARGPIASSVTALLLALSVGLGGAFSGSSAWADLKPSPSSMSGETLNIATVPPPIQQPPPAEGRDTFRCSRDFIYKGKTRDCDSLVRQDGEGLRPYIQDTPQAVNELNDYQSTRRQARAVAYIGSLALLTGIAGLIIGRVQAANAPPICGSPNPPPGVCPTNIGPIIGYSGLGALGASLIYGITLIKSNESHLLTAVQLHNDAHPNQPIELKFSTGFVF